MSDDLFDARAVPMHGLRTLMADDRNKELDTPAELEWPDYLEDDDAECPECAGEGFVFDCFDGCCAAYLIGCDDCTRPCPTCNGRYAALTHGA